MANTNLSNAKNKPCENTPAEKNATTIDEQIALLRSRGMEIGNEQKARENLMDIGYYRLGFYWFPFEISYPRTKHRNHNFRPGTHFEYAIKLYYFDYDLRNLLLRYISRVEINFRTKVIYFASNKHKDDPAWYVNRKYVKPALLKSSEYRKAIAELKRETVVRNHAKLHPEHRNAPAWKALEFMSFGTIIKIYESLADGGLRMQIARECGVDSPRRLSSYINTIRRLRNSCAHGKVLFDLKLGEAISTGGAVRLTPQSKTMFSGAYSVLHYMLGQISENRAQEIQNQLYQAFLDAQAEEVRQVIRHSTGLAFSPPIPSRPNNFFENI